MPCSLRLCSASSCVVVKVMPPHCSHLNDLFVFDSSGPGGLDISIDDSVTYYLCINKSPLFVKAAVIVF